MEYINGTFSSIGYWKFAEFFGNDRDIASTDDVPEGNSNIYFTNSRVDSRLDSRLNSGISSLSVQNLIVTNDLTISSDRRLKTNIEPIQKSIKSLKPFQFTYNSQPDSLRYGFIAQDVQSTFPEMVREDKDGNLSVNYIDTIALLLDNQQKLEKRIEILESRK